MLGGLLGGFFGNKYDRPDQVGQDVSSNVKSDTYSQSLRLDRGQDGYQGARVLGDTLISTPIEGYEGSNAVPMSSTSLETGYYGTDGTNLGQNVREINMPNYSEYLFKSHNNDETNELGFYKKMNPNTNQMEWYSPGASWGGGHPEGFVDQKYIDNMRNAQILRQQNVMDAIQNENLGDIEKIMNPEGSVTTGPIMVNPGYYR